MARKGIMEGLLSALPEEGAPALSTDRVGPETSRPARVSRGAVGAVSRVFDELELRGENLVDPSLIHDDGFQDRITAADDEIPKLRDSIQKNGQRVPILIRPHPDRPGEFRVVYGRRRLVAIRGIPGLKIKALIQSLSDDEAILAQGTENSGRRDPSFIEKSLFAAQLRAAKRPASLIYDALLVDSALLSRMRAITDAVPEDLIRMIGAAPGVGRRRWEDLAELTRGMSPEQVVAAAFPEGMSPETSSDERFDAALRELTLRRSDNGQTRGLPKGILEARLPDGRTIALLKASRASLKLDVSKKDHPEFAAWLETERDRVLSEIYRIWAAEVRQTQRPDEAQKAGFRAQNSA